MTQVVRIVRQEVGHSLASEGEKSFHWIMEQDLKTRKEVPAIEMTDTFTSIEVPDIDHGGRPLSKKAIERSRNALASPKARKTPKNSSKGADNASSAKQNSKSTKPAAPKKSIYDDDALDTGYVVSDGEQDDHDDFDEDYFSGPEEAEEYLSDESDERFDSFDEDEYGDPTVTTATGSWDSPTGAADPSSNKDSAARRPHLRDQEEKKQDETAMTNSGAASSPRGPLFSEVGKRLLTFIMLFNDERNPSDNYASLAESILDEVSRSVVDEIVSMPLPPYAEQYLEEGARTEGMTLRDVASPKCRELIHKLFYFLGRFDFGSETGGILLNRTSDSTTVQVRSTEWTFSTEVYNEAPEVEPGVAEAQVWETGIIPMEEVGYMGATFKAMRRSICFMFTKNAKAYHNEVQCRAELGVAIEGGSFSDSHIVPLISHFDATSIDRKEDRMYKNDCSNESFMMLDIFGQKGNTAGESICLADYPYALVFPYSNYGDLFDYFFRHGVDGIEETREICTQIGKSLSSMHEKGIIHGNISMRNIVLFPPVEDTEMEEGRKHWALTNLSGACRLQDSNSYMGKISAQGLAEFFSASMPPEMFVKLSQDELKEYREYWDAVEKEYGASVDRSVVEPVVDFQTGAFYVMRCHFVPEAQRGNDTLKALPPLPYKLLPARESADVWAFGQLLFMLCSCGRPLFPSNARTGNLLNYKEICEWDMQAAESRIYEFVENPLAQDILLRLLAPYEQRKSLTMETLLSHPFFNDGDMNSSVSRAIAEKRTQASIAFRRWLDNNVTEKSEEGFLKERTISVSCWDFSFQTRIHLTPTALIPDFVSLTGEQAGMPCGFLVLPYKLVRNKKGVLTPPSKRDVERAERLGLRMLALGKACHYANAIKKVVTSIQQSKGWSITALLSKMDVAKEDFQDLQGRFERLASEHVELFRSDPVKVGLKMINEQVKELLACYEDSSKVLLYLVDEYKGVPSVGPHSTPFPHVVESPLKSEIALHGLPFMYLCARYFRAISGVPGFVKLIFEAASPHVPPSWRPVCKGLDNSMDHQSIVDDVSILCDALLASSSASLDDSFHYMQRYISEVDPRRMYANLKRVSCGEASVWTGDEGVAEIEKATKGFGFKEAMKAKIETDEKLASQEARIKELEEELDKLRWRNAMSLKVPELEVTKPAPASLNTSMFSPTVLAADLYERGMKCMEANVDMISARTSCTANVVVESPKEGKVTATHVAASDEEEGYECSKAETGDDSPNDEKELASEPVLANDIEAEEEGYEYPRAESDEDIPSDTCMPISADDTEVASAAEDEVNIAAQRNQNAPSSPENQQAVVPDNTQSEAATTATPAIAEPEEKPTEEPQSPKKAHQERMTAAAAELDDIVAKTANANGDEDKEECPAAALLSYLQEDHRVETTVVEAEQDFADGLLEGLSFECIDSANNNGSEIPSIETDTDNDQLDDTEEPFTEPTLEQESVALPTPTTEHAPIRSQEAMELKIDAHIANSPSTAEDGMQRTLLDDMFAEADLVFSQPTPRAQAQKSPYSSPRHVAPPSNPTSPAVHRETRDEDARDSADYVHPGVEESPSFLEVTHKELSELKQAVIAGRTASRESRTNSMTGSFTDMFQKEMDDFESELKSLGSNIQSPSNKPLTPSISKGIVGRNTSLFSFPTSPKSPREPSEVASSLGGSSISTGNVKRLSNFFLGGGADKEKPTIEVNSESPDRPKLSSPQSKFRRAALESSPEEKKWD